MSLRLHALLNRCSGIEQPQPLVEEALGARHRGRHRQVNRSKSRQLRRERRISGLGTSRPRHRQHNGKENEEKHHGPR